MNVASCMKRLLLKLVQRTKLAASFMAGVGAICVAVATPAAAGLVLRIGPETTSVTRPTAGNTTTVTLTVFVRADANTESIANYTVPIDLSPPGGPGKPIGMTLGGGTIRTLFPERTFTSSPLNDPNGEADFMASVVGPFTNPVPPPVVFTTDFSPLFDFTISIDDTVALGDYSANAVRGVLLSFDPGLTDSVQFSPPAVLRVVAVPEPSGLGVLGLVGVLFALRRKRLLQPS